GALEGPSAYFYKHPPRQYTDDEAYRMVGDFIKSHQDDTPSTNNDLRT
ncbi:MAG: inositol-3-phosphate synthase, partial [Syntrophobacterales bacterium]